MDTKLAIKMYKKYSQKIEELRKLIADELIKDVKEIKENENVKLLSTSPTIYTINSKCLTGKSWNIEYYSNTILSKKLIACIDNMDLDGIIKTLYRIKDEGKFGKYPKETQCNDDFRKKITEIIKKIES